MLVPAPEKCCSPFGAAHRGSHSERESVRTWLFAPVRAGDVPRRLLSAWRRWKLQRRIRGRANAGQLAKRLQGYLKIGPACQRRVVWLARDFLVFGERLLQRLWADDLVGRVEFRGKRQVRLPFVV